MSRSVVPFVSGMQTPSTISSESAQQEKEGHPTWAKARPDELFIRYKGNPILTAADWPYPINTAFNPGATLLADGTTLLLCRIEDRKGSSHLCSARSRNGFDGWEVDSIPSLMPSPDEHPEEAWGIEDPRITYLPEIGRYAVTYTSFSSTGPGVSLALTEDFRHFERLGQIMPPENKDAALFPRRIGGYWALIHRPVIGGSHAHIWVSYSPDLTFWGMHKTVLSARPGPWWDSARVGLACPPIETEDGWLVIYHGVKTTVAGAIYRLGLALLDLGDPRRCLARSNRWVMTPEAPYELVGDIHNVVFPCGYTRNPINNDILNIYYGGADNCIAVATANINDLLDFLRDDCTT